MSDAKAQNNTLSFTLTAPPSVNRLYRTYRGRVIKSADYRTWQQIATYEINQQIPDNHDVWTSGAVSITLVWYRPARRGDVDNLLKASQDIFEGVVYKNDNMISESHTYRVDGDDNPRVEITIERLVE